MRLYRSYRTRRTWWLALRYELRVGIELTRQEATVIARHRLAADELAAGPMALELDDRAESALDLAREVEGWDTAATGKAIKLKARGIVTALVTANREARLTVGQLIAGTTFECADVVEAGMMLNEISAGFEALQEKVAMLIAFDAGEESITEPETEDDGVPPSEWGRFQ